MSTDTATKTTQPSVGEYLRKNIREYGLLVALVVIMIFFQVITNGVLFRPVNITNLVLQYSYILILAMGMLLVIVAAQIDLSVGSVVALAQASNSTQVWAKGPPKAAPRPLPFGPLFVASVAPRPWLASLMSQAVPAQSATSAAASKS